MWNPASLFEDVFSDVSTQRPVLPDQRLQSPLKPDIGSLALNYWFKGPAHDKTPTWIKRTVNQMSKSFPALFVNVHEGDWNEYSSLMYSRALAQTISLENKRVFDRLLNIAWTTTAAFHQGIHKQPWKPRPYDIWQSTLSLFEARQQARMLKMAMMKTSRGRDIAVQHVKCLGCVFLLSRQLCLLNDPTHGTIFVDYDAILCLNDVLDQRYLASLSLQVYQLMYPDVYTISQDDLKVILEWGDKHLAKLGNNAFGVIKTFESICMAEMLRQSHPINVSENFLQQRHDDYIAAGGDIRQMTNLSTMIRNHQIPMISELFGMFRIWGHPVVDETAGCAKVQKIGKAEVKPDSRILKKIRACFVREFCLNYIKHEGRWPELTVINPKSRIAKLYARQQTNWIQSKDQLDLTEWEDVVLGKNFDFDYCKDFTQLIEDKSISTYLEHWDSVYDAELLGYTPPSPVESRRVILEMLSRSDIRIEEILHMIMTRKVPAKWFVIGLHSKERELKVEPRLFVMLVLEMRLYFCVTEYNLAEKIFKYFPQQTMTSSEPDLVTRLLKVTDRSDVKRDVIPVVINIDFEKWNLRWRKSTTDGIFKVIDNLFGTPGLYTFSHEFFERSMFYLVSRYHPPKVDVRSREHPEEQETVWYNDQSGKEGIRQKGWTLITIAALIYVETETNVHSVITGQGDNQVIIASFPVPEGVTREEHLNNSISGLRQSIDNYMNVLINTFEKIGLPIKREESWTSLGLFAYGKDIIWNGAIMPMCIKRCMRIVPDVNDTFPTLANNLSTIFSSGQSACAKGFDIYIPYFLALMEAGLYILTSRGYHVISHGPHFPQVASTLIQIDDCFLQFILVLAHALGGYPVMNPVDYIARGHSDPVTTGLLALRYLGNIFPHISRIISFLQVRKPFAESVDFKYIISDPTAINWDIPKPPTMMMKEIIQSEFSSICQNKQINYLFHHNAVDEERELVDLLSKIRPFSPRVLNEIYRNSPCGARDGVLATVSHVRTIRTMAQRSPCGDIFSRLAEYEREFIMHMVDWYQSSLNCSQLRNFCSRQLADEWRSLSWFKDSSIIVEGVTMPHPLEQFVINCCENPNEVTGEAIIYILEPSAGRDRLTEIGKNCAFIGSLTKERKMSRLLNQAVNDPPLKAALRLQTVTDYTVLPHGNLAKIMDGIITSRTNIPLKYLRCSADRVIAGSRTHRLEDVTAKRGGLLNVRPNFTSHVYYSTDFMGRFSRGFENYNINYLLVIACNMVQLQYDNYHHTTRRKVFISRLSCPSCTVTLNEEPLELTEATTLNLTSYSNCYLVYSKHDSDLIEGIMIGGSCVTPIIANATPIDDMLEYVAYMLALQVILRADRATIGNVYGSQTFSPRYQNVILGIGEIALVGFKRLVVAIAHLNTLLFLIKYFNRIIMARGIDVHNILQASRETLNLELYSELIQAFPMPSVQGEIMALLPDFVIPANALTGSAGASAVIQAIVDMYLTDKIKDLVTLPPFQSGSFPEWYIVAELNIMHRILRTALLMDNLNSECLGRVCVALKTAARLESPSTGTELVQLLMQGVSRAINHTMGKTTSPDLLRLAEELKTINFTSKPLMHTEEGVEKWLSILKQRISRQTHRSSSEAVRYNERRHIPPPCVYLKPYIAAEYSFECNQVTEFAILPEEPVVRTPDKTRHDHVWRLDGVSTAHYKVMQLLNWFNIRPITAVCLGEGEGSIAAMLYKIFNVGLIFYNSKLDSRLFPTHRYIHYIPAELSVVPSNVIFEYNLTLYGPNDITTVECQSLIVDTLPHNAWDLITCDAEIARLGHIEAYNLLRGVLLIALPLLANNGYLLFKTYIGLENVCSQQLSALIAAFENVWVTCPHYSSFESSEVYIVCKNKRVNFISQITMTLHNGLYPASKVDFNYILSSIQRLKVDRTVVHFPLQFLAEIKCIKMLKYVRCHYDRPIWRNSLSILIGSRYNGSFPRLEHWLLRRATELHGLFNVLLASLFEQTHTGIDWIRLASVLSRNQDTGIQMYSYIRQILHSDLLLLTIYLKRAGIPLRQCLNILEQELSKTRDHHLSDGTHLCSFNLRLHEPAWRKKYARHFFHLVGEIYFFE
ncbi:RNA-dependent RNA polymerase [Amsterdam virus]|uniref:RNA-directed RNA polymerase L n=1 Tax=Amsterdam virus TaxID=2613795 RepID=A0AAE6TCM0_9MONO|nr:RNA-dependent RNA polymerase [Amsterdam virus]QEQ50497.1 RNA-dependent RNA polymerase [Amsterdam virus]